MDSNPLFKKGISSHTVTLNEYSLLKFHKCHCRNTSDSTASLGLAVGIGLVGCLFPLDTVFLTSLIHLEYYFFLDIHIVLFSDTSSGIPKGWYMMEDLTI